MSYILDALRRADAERDRGAVPSLNSQSTMGSSTRRGPSQVNVNSKLPWIIAAGLTLGLGGLYWTYRVALKDQETPAVVKAPVVAAAPSAPAVPAAVAPTPAAPVAATAVPTLQAAPNVAPTTPRIAVPTAAPATVRRPSPPAAQPARTTAPAPVAQAAVHRASPTDRILNRTELPADVQRALPALAMSGSVYSPQPKNRMVIVDGRLSFEGEQVVPGLIIERIDPKAVVLRYQGLRFNVPL